MLDPESLFLAFGYLAVTDLEVLRGVSRSVGQMALLDRLWKPLFQRHLRGKLCLQQGPLDALTKAATFRTQGNYRSALQLAVKDSTRCILSPDEVADLTYQMRFRPEATQRLPAELDPIMVKFALNNMMVSAHEHPVIDVSLPFRFIDSLPSLEIVEGRPQFSPEANRACDFTTIRIAERPPMRVARHPGHWGVVLCHYHVFFSSWVLRAGEEQEPELATMPKYYHPVLLTETWGAGQGD